MNGDRAKWLAEWDGISHAEAAQRIQAGAYRSSDRPPLTCNPHVGEVYDWLEVNGVHELLPPDPTITVKDGMLSFTAFRWEQWQDDRWTVGNEQYEGDLSTPITETRAVLLVVPVTEAVRVAARAFSDDEDCRFTLVEQVAVDCGDSGDDVDAG